MVQTAWHITFFRPAGRTGAPPGRSRPRPAGGATRPIRRRLLPAALLPALLLANPLPGAPALAAGLANAPQSAAAAPAVARDARLAGDAQRTRLILDLDRPVPIRTFTLANPYRVVLDLDDVVFAMAPDAAQLRRGLVAAYRYGALAPGKARMVLDATGPVAIEKAFILDPADDQPARLVLDLARTDAESFARALAGGAGPRPAVAAPPASPALDAPADARPVIVLDPGHGGLDSGTTGYTAFAEKNIVLETGLALREKLERTGAYKVVMTRSSDVFIPLGERVRIARANRAALFISLHADALARNDGKARGASIYTLSDTASDADAARLAEQENKADLIAGVDLSEESNEVAGILVDLAQRETRSFSAHFARELMGSMKGVARTHRGALKSAGFRVLRAHDVPSVLVELGYMSSREDLKLLTSETWRDQLTDAMLEAINAFFAAQVAGTPPPGAGQATARAEPARSAN